MGFWDSKKTPQEPQQQQQQPVAPKRAFWQPEEQVQPQQYGQPQQPQHPLMQQGQQPQQEYVPSRKLGSMGAEGTCPGCGSSNYMEVGKKTTERGVIPIAQCFECGFPVENSERGTPGVGGDRSDGRARQIAGAGGVVHNYHENQVFAHIDDRGQIQHVNPGQRR